MKKVSMVLALALFGFTLSANTVVGVGVSLSPHQKLQSFGSREVETKLMGETETFDLGEGDFVNTRLSGYQLEGKVRHIFGSGFALGGDADVGYATPRVSGERTDIVFFDFNADLAVGYAVVNNDRFLLVPSALAGFQYAYSNMGTLLSEPSDADETTGQLLAFEFGGELLASYRFTPKVGVYVACKVLKSIGVEKDVLRYGDDDPVTITDTLKNTSTLTIKPSAGLTFTI